jgi:hypothetical protein
MSGTGTDFVDHLRAYAALPPPAYDFLHDR